MICHRRTAWIRRPWTRTTPSCSSRAAGLPVTLPRPSPPPDQPAGPAQVAASAGPTPDLVEAPRVQRVRKPADLLRGLACIVGVVVLACLGIVASATAD